jgi:hypothetical protein
MSREFEKLVEAAKAFDNFLEFAENSEEDKMSITTFRSAFEEANNKERLSEDEEERVEKLYKKYEAIKR